MRPALILPVVVFACSQAATLPANLGFEQWPLAWSGGRPGYELAQDLEVKHGGNASGRIAARDLSLPDKKAAPLVQRIPASGWRGKRVRLSGWLRTQGVTTGFAGLWMRVDSKAERNLVFDNMRRRGPRGTTDWTRYEVVLDVPREASVISFGVVLAGDGTVWADDLAIDEAPPGVPSTAMPRSEQ